MDVVIKHNYIADVKFMEEKSEKIILEMWGLQCQEYAADKAPVDTGRLKRSMTHQVGNGYVDVGTNVEYAKYQEYGTNPSGRKGVSAKHFLRDAVQNHSDEYKRIAEQVLQGIL